jgi:hypothetical protein
MVWNSCLLLLRVVYGMMAINNNPAIFSLVQLFLIHINQFIPYLWSSISTLDHLVDFEAVTNLKMWFSSH